MNELAGPILWMHEGEKINCVNNNTKVDFEKMIDQKIIVKNTEVVEFVMNKIIDEVFSELEKCKVSCKNCNKKFVNKYTMDRHRIEAPKQVREDGDFFKYLKLEREIERAHTGLFSGIFYYG